MHHFFDPRLIQFCGLYFQNVLVEFLLQKSSSVLVV